MVAAARIVTAVRDLALEFPDPVVTTVGRFAPSPGIINQIPGEVVLSVDVRHWTEVGLEELTQRTYAVIQQVAAEEKVSVEVDPFWRIAPTHFDPAVLAAIEESARELAIPFRQMTSGAGHDAKYISQIAPTAMIFVRTIGGKSHCETESILWEDAQAATDVLLQTVLRLAT